MVMMMVIAIETAAEEESGCWQADVFCRRQNLGRSSNPAGLDMMTILAMTMMMMMRRRTMMMMQL